MLLPCRLDVCTKQIKRSCDGHTAKVGPAPAPYGQSPTLHFSVANHKHKGNFGFFRFSNLESNFFISQVGFGAEARSFELGHNLGHVGVLVVRDCHDRRLHWGEPGWKGPAEVLDQNAEEPFDRAH